MFDLVPTILHEPTPKFDFLNPPTDPIQLAKGLAETMLFHNGIGLAANQCGLPYRLFVIKAAPIIAVFNPVIVDVSTEMVELEEGCLSFPNLYLKIKRPRRIKVRFTRPNGETVTEKFSDLTARVFQHEAEHLDGIVFTNHVSKLELDIARRKAKKRK